MPNYNPPSNLVQAAFDAYNAPIQSQILQQDLAIKKQEVQSGQMALQNQVGLQQDMTQIWGPGGMAAAATTATDPNADQSSMPKMLATARALFAHGQPQAGASFLSSLSLMGNRSAQQQKIAQQVQWRKIEAIGSSLGTVTDQASEDVAIAEIKAQGIDPSTYGIKGDWDVDGPRIPQLARMAMTKAQQLQAADREQGMQNTENQRDFMNGITATRLQQSQDRLAVAQNNSKLEAMRIQNQQDEANKRDARAQEGLAQRALGREDRQFANAARVQPQEAQMAQGIFSSDTRTQGLPPALQKSLANLAMARAKKRIANDMLGSGDMEYEPDDVGSALEEEMEKMQRQGMFSSSEGGMFGGGGDYTFNPGAKGAPTPMPKPATAAKDESTTLQKMEKDPRAMDIKQKVQSKQMSVEEAKAALAKLGY